MQSRFRGRGMDFDELREYEPGDDVRAIDWNASARTGRTFVKKYREERQLTVVFVVDMSASGALGAGEATKREQAVEIAGVLALAALRSDHRVGPPALHRQPWRSSFRRRAGERTRPRLVRDLVVLPADGQRDETSARRSGLFASAASARRRRRPFRLPVSAKDAAALRTELAVLARRHDVVGIRTGDKHDRELPSVGLLTLEDAETGEVVEIDTGERSPARARSPRRSRRPTRAFARSSRDAQVDLLEVDTLKPYLGPLIGFFKSRGVRS